MDSEKVIQDLNRKFAEPLPDFYKRRIVFWYDEEQEFKDKLGEIVLDNAKVIALDGHNSFTVKKLLSLDDTTSNYLVYIPFLYASDADNWLLDIELYSDMFRADLVSMWMDEMGLPTTMDLRRCIKYYRKYFNAKDRRNKIFNQKVLPVKPAQMHLAVMAALCGLKEATPSAIIHEVLKTNLDNEANDSYQNMVNYDADKAFWQMVAMGTGYQEDEPSIKELTKHLLLTALTRTIPKELLGGLDRFISEPHQSYCYDLISDWMTSTEDAEQMYIASTRVEDEVELHKRFMKLEINQMWDTEVFPCVNEVILVKLLKDIGHQLINVEYITQTVEHRRTCAWYEKYQNYFEAILQVAKMQAFYKKHSGGFHSVKARTIWDEYTKEYYLMDTYYRTFHKYYSLILTDYNPDLQELVNHVKDVVEGLYGNWFLSQLGSNWSDVCADELKEYGKILEVTEQKNFYYNNISQKDNRIFVIISDAFRYECAVSLAEQLKRETQSKVELSSMQSTFPSITKFGMAALLPNKSISVEVKSTAKTERLAVLVDGMSSEANNREKVLQTKNINSVALQYKNIIGMKRAERSALVKNKSVVYIYHDKVDSASHTDEKAVFPACDEAIEEIKNLIRIIVNEFSGMHIIVTADHGFLYNYEPLQEDSKVDKTSDSSLDVEYGRRYAIMQAGAKPHYLMPVKFLNGTTEFEAFAPRENIRIKMKGAGINFVHGGISLQEMVVPVLDYRYLRNDSKEYQRNRNKYDTKPVSIKLLSSSRKISNLLFSLQFYQTEPVSDNREPATYQLYFVDSDGRKISEPEKIIADRSSINEQERIFRTQFNLKSLKYKKTENYYLVIADENGLQIAKEEFQIDIAFAVDEFDFFSF